MSIDRFHGDHRFLSNFWIAPRTYPVIGVCDTAEHFYQAMKCVTAEDRERIKNAATAGAAKRAGRNAAITPVWEERKLHVMRLALKIKFEAGSDVARALLATGDEFLREGNTWGDRFWGAEQVAHEDGPKWVGQNWLGHLLMAQRAVLRADL